MAESISIRRSRGLPVYVSCKGNAKRKIIAENPINNFKYHSKEKELLKHL